MGAHPGAQKWERQILGAKILAGLSSRIPKLRTWSENSGQNNKIDNGVTNREEEQIIGVEIIIKIEGEILKLQMEDQHY